MQAEQEDQNFNQVQIDEEWISSGDQLIIDPNLLMCQVCYGIPLQNYAECEKCGRIFCQKDYKQVKASLNSCPNCKNSPFTKKLKPHILYTSLFSRILFQCQLCDQKKQMNEENPIQLKDNEQKGRKRFTKQQLSDHILSNHNRKVMDFTILYDFEIDLDKGSEKIVFDMYQNIQLNQRYQKGKLKIKKQEDFPYQLDSGDIVVINFEKQIVTSPTLMKAGRLIKRPSKTLKKGVDYKVWSVLLDIDFKYYSEKYQDMIKKEYEQFINNPRKNEFTLDIGHQRYRISFPNMSQINTYTGYQRPIRKNNVKFI